MDDLVWDQDVFVQKKFSLDDSKIESLAKKYSPILLYHKEEEFYPMSLDDMFSEIADINKSINFDGVLGRNDVPCSEVGEFMAYNGERDYTFDTRNLNQSDLFSDITGSFNNANVYYSFFEEGEKFYINYHFLYAYDPKTGTAENPGSAAHNFDRESITLEFNKNSTEYVPENVIYAGHLLNQDMILKDKDSLTEGSEYQKWFNARVSIPFSQVTTSFSNRPCISIAKGSHALFPVSGFYKVISQKGKPWAGVKQLQLVEPAGIIDNLLIDEGDSRPNVTKKVLIKGQRVLFPKTNNSYKNENTYTLKPLGLDSLSNKDYLIFSGYWVDAPLWYNGKFPPFTEREIDVESWCDNASDFDLTNIPDISKRTIEQFNNGYLFSKTKVKNFKAVAKDDRIEMTWEGYEEADSYRIMRTEWEGDKKTEEKQLGWVGKGYASDSDVVPGKTYSYTIQAIYKIDEEKYGGSNTYNVYNQPVEMFVDYKKDKVKVTVTLINKVTMQGADKIDYRVKAYDSNTYEIVDEVSGPFGSYELELPPGTYTFSAYTPGISGVRSDVEINEENNAVTIEIRLIGVG